MHDVCVTCAKKCAVAMGANVLKLPINAKAPYCQSYACSFVFKSFVSTSLLSFFSVILRAIQNFSEALRDNFSGDNLDYQVTNKQKEYHFHFSVFFAGIVLGFNLFFLCDLVLCIFSCGTTILTCQYLS